MINPQSIFILIILIIVGSFLLETILSFLNATRFSFPLPERLAGIYDAEKYNTYQQYLKAKHRFSMLNDAFSFVVILVMLLLGGFVWADEMSRHLLQSTILQSLLFFGILGLGYDILGMPFDIYFTFRIEQRFGFNTTTPRTFILDKLKSWLLGIILGGGILSIIVLIYLKTGNWFWIIAWGVISLFSVFMSMFYSNLIVPLFNKQKPLEAGELRSKIEAFANTIGFKLNNIYVIDGSKRSKKSNAYFTGIGPKKRIVLYDTLIEENSPEELVAVLAHEMGHYKLKHTLQGLIISLLSTGLTLWILSLFLQYAVFTQALGFAIPSFQAGLIAFGMLFTPISLVTGVLSSMLSRKNEYAADRFACLNYKPQALATALINLSRNNMSNLFPHPSTVFLYYSHPPLMQRLAKIDEVTEQESPTLA